MSVLINSAIGSFQRGIHDCALRAMDSNAPVCIEDIVKNVDNRVSFLFVKFLSHINPVNFEFAKFLHQVKWITNFYGYREKYTTAIGKINEFVKEKLILNSRNLESHNKLIQEIAKKQIELVKQKTILSSPSEYFATRWGNAPLEKGLVTENSFLPFDIADIGNDLESEIKNLKGRLAHSETEIAKQSTEILKLKSLYFSKEITKSIETYQATLEKVLPLNKKIIHKDTSKLDKKFFAMLQADTKINKMGLNSALSSDAYEYFLKFTEKYKEQFSLEKFFDDIKLYQALLKSNSFQNDLKLRINSMKVGEKIYIPVDIEVERLGGHAMAEVIEKKENGVLLISLVNSSYGLKLNQKKKLNGKVKALPVKEFEIDSKEYLNKLPDLRMYATEKDAEAVFFKSKGRIILKEPITAVTKDTDYITGQRGGSCTLRVLFQLLRHHMSHTDYKKMKFLIKSDQILEEYNSIKAKKICDAQFKELFIIAVEEKVKRIRKMEKLLGREAFNEFFPLAKQAEFAEIIDFAKQLS